MISLSGTNPASAVSAAMIGDSLRQSPVMASPRAVLAMRRANWDSSDDLFENPVGKLFRMTVRLQIFTGDYREGNPNLSKEYFAARPFMEEGSYVYCGNGSHFIYLVTANIDAAIELMLRFNTKTDKEGVLA